MNDTKDVHLLTLVLVYPLDLNIEQCSWVDCDASGGLNMLRKADLVGILNLGPLLLELLVINILLKLIEVVEVLEESKTTSGLTCDQLGKSGIGLVQPTSWGDAVGHVGELIWSENLDKVPEDGGLDQI